MVYYIDPVTVEITIESEEALKDAFASAFVKD